MAGADAIAPLGGGETRAPSPALWRALVRDLVKPRVLRRIAQLPGGGNNRVFRIATDREAVLLKHYFHHPLDPRDRARAEFAFSRYAWSHGVRCIPEPLASMASCHLSLFEFVDGRPLGPGQVAADHVDQALEFFLLLNRRRATITARRLNAASESCVSLGSHVTLVERRLARLNALATDGRLDPAASSFLAEDLATAWKEIRARIQRVARRARLHLDRPIAEGNRVISPSDFGFHNALVRRDGTLCFLDFEYAGWDDPTKMVCDFFCQPAVPVPATYLGAVTRTVACALADRTWLETAVGLLMPASRVRWCTMLLSEFVPESAQRRRFASRSAGSPRRLREQLLKARAMLAAAVSEVP